MFLTRRTYQFSNWRRFLSVQPSKMEPLSKRTIRHPITDIFQSESSNPTEDIKNCLILVNSESMWVPMVRKLWDRFCLRICADGAANRLFENLPSEEQSRYIPDVICGDLDSVTESVKTFYSSHGTQIVKDTDQNYNDLHKCLGHIAARFGTDAQNARVTIIGGLEGRFDQEMAAIQALYCWKWTFRSLALMTRENIVFLLTGSEPLAHKPSEVVLGTLGTLQSAEESKEDDSSNKTDNSDFVVIHRLSCGQGLSSYCGLLPIGGAVRKIWTRGLRWNLSGESLKFGGLVSTSNSLVPVESSGLGLSVAFEDVLVATSDDVVWTCSIAECAFLNDT